MNKRILVNDLGPRYRRYRQDLVDAITGVIDSGWVVQGPQLRDFENAFARYLGVGHCIGVGNGTDAIEIGLRALGVGPGDPVATVANAGMYASHAIYAIGAQPIFMDVDPLSACVTLSGVQSAIAGGARVVIITHLYGRVVPESIEIARYCQGSNVRLFEDCAQAHGAMIAGQRAGSIGNAASFSFYPTKNLGALGDGGAVVTSDTAMAERIKQLRQYGWTSKYAVGLSGGRNSRLDEVQAAILIKLLHHLDRENTRRRSIAQRYRTGISNSAIQLPVPPTNDSAEDVCHLFVARCALRDQFRAYLQGCGIATEIHYPIPDHQQAPYSKQFTNISLPVTDRLAREVVTLPCYPDLHDEDIDYIIEAINAWAP